MARSYESFPEIGSEDVTIQCFSVTDNDHAYLLFGPEVSTLTGTAAAPNLSEDLTNLTELPSQPPSQRYTLAGCCRSVVLPNFKPLGIYL